MKKIFCAVATAIILIASSASADVRIEMATQDISGEEPRNQRVDNVIMARGDLIRIDNVGGAPGHMSMIFREADMIMLNHDEKTWRIIDEAMLAKMDSQMSEAAKMMEQQMASLPPEQRAMAEQMMQGRMPAGMGGQMAGMGAPPAEEASPLRIEAAGASKWGGYPCVKYNVFDGATLQQEICAASLDHIESGSEMVAAFEKMAAFMDKMTATFKIGPSAKAGDTPLNMMDDINGFPVVTRHIENGEPVHEVFLKSVSSSKLDPGLFVPPSDYKRHDL